MVTKMAKPEHGFSNKAVVKALEKCLLPGWTWRQEQPVRMTAYDEPEPDVTIMRGSDADYRHRIPEATDVVLLVEVSATGVSALRQQANVYARAAYQSTGSSFWSTARSRSTPIRGPLVMRPAQTFHPVTAYPW